MMLRSDTPLAGGFLASPNHDERVADKLDMVILHYTGMTTADVAIERLCDPDAKVSSHYVVHESGGIIQLVSETRRAWHAGVSTWRGEPDINSRSIGIEIVNPGHDYGYPDFPDEQIEAIIRLCGDIASRWPIRPDQVLAHSDVAPNRKQDPGEKFPWRRLSEKGVGLWVDAEPTAATASVTVPEDAHLRAKILQGLFRYGYGTHDSEGSGSASVISAFQRHFRPLRVDGKADMSTAITLDRLLRKQEELHSSGVSS